MTPIMLKDESKVRNEAELTWTESLIMLAITTLALGLFFVGAIALWFMLIEGLLT